MTEPAFGRLFVALMPDDAVRAALRGARDRWIWSAGARATRDDDLHATLVFLGAVEAARMAALMAALPVDFAPFTLRFDRSTVWENGIAALEPTGDLTALTALQAAVAGRIAAAGLPRETRRYRPHVTLAREADGSTPPQDDDALVWPVSDYALVASRAGRYDARDVEGLPRDVAPGGRIVARGTNRQRTMARDVPGRSGFPGPKNISDRTE